MLYFTHLLHLCIVADCLLDADVDL